MNMTRRGFLGSLLAAAPALMLAGPAGRALASALKADQPKLPEWFGGRRFSVGRHVVAWIEGPARVSEISLRFDPDDKRPGSPSALFSVVRKGGLVAQWDVGGLYPLCWQAASHGEIFVPAGGRLELLADLPRPGFAGGFLIDSERMGVAPCC